MKISIITAAYNAEKYIDNCIQAIINSNYDLANVEHIIVDDGSTDNTKQICEKWAAKYPHIKFYSKPNGNWGSVMNYVKNNKLATGEYIVICDSDDMVAPDAFKIVSERNENADIVAGNWYFYNGEEIGKKRGNAFLYLFKNSFIKKNKYQYLHSTFLPCCTYFKTEKFYMINDLKEGLVFQDGVLFAQLQLVSTKIQYIRDALGYYWRLRPGNSCSMGVGMKPIAITSVLSVLQFYADNKLLDLFVEYLFLSHKWMRKYLDENKITFDFTGSPRLSLKIWPLWMRNHIKLVYWFKLRKYVKK